MKKIVAIMWILLLSTNFIYAAEESTNNKVADHFQVTADPTSIKVGEATDLTIKVLDKDWEIVKDYLWTIYITVDNDTKATIPYENWYSFIESDLWQKVFSKWLSFTKEWQMKVSVLDIDNDDLIWYVNITVVSGWTTTPIQWDITILSPDNWVTIPENFVTVNGISKKNSKVQFFLNSTKSWESQTDNDGNFSFKLTWLNSQSNVISVKVLDGTNNVIAESDQIIVSVESEWSPIKGFSIKWWNSIEAWSSMDIEITSDPSLQEITISLDGMIENLKESSTPWVYVWTITAPKKPWDYKIDVNLKNALWKTTSKPSVSSITVLESNIFKNITYATKDKRAILNFELEENKENEIEYFKIKYSTWNDLSNAQSIVTFEKEKIKSNSWWYTWYIPNLNLDKYYFEIYALDKDKIEINWKPSQIIDVDLSLKSWQTMAIISNLKTSKISANQNELIWETIPEATSYNVYKRDKDGNFQLIENVKTNKYIVNIIWNELKYEDFAVKWVYWDSAAESPDFSNVTKIQTWPMQIMLLLIIAFTFPLLYFYLRKKKF